MRYLRAALAAGVVALLAMIAWVVLQVLIIPYIRMRLESGAGGGVMGGSVSSDSTLLVGVVTFIAMFVGRVRRQRPPGR